ncbi:MAG: MinD/ParA family protein [Gammaproteobacteria bacterium]|nr:MinD/ParA family protein [Gammaproteobacteria bacterium]
MSAILSVHSFRGGTGKSNTTANLAAVLARKGLRIGVADTDLQSPGIHVLFGLDSGQLDGSLNAFLWGDCPIEEAVHEVTRAVSRHGEVGKGQVFLMPASMETADIARVLKQGFDVGRMNDGFRQAIAAFDLDLLLIDTHPGVNEETLLSIAISDALVLLVRPDQQDFQGTAVTVELARQLDVQNMSIVLNKVLPSMNKTELRAKAEAAFGTDVAAVLEQSEDMLELGSADLYALIAPDSAYSVALNSLADYLHHQIEARI